MPGWEIIEWNESNYVLGKVPYVLEAYEERMWAFVSDYARFDILLAHGGVYMDTDVELLKAIPDWVFDNDAFTGMDTGAIVSPGLMLGCVANHAFAAEVLESYERDHFLVDGRLNRQTVNYRVTEILERHGFRRVDELQRVAGVTVYPAEYFCGYDVDIFEPYITPKTVSMHHYAHSWGGRYERLRRRAQGALKRALGTANYRRLLQLKRHLIGVRSTARAAVERSRKDGPA